MNFNPSFYNEVKVSPASVNIPTENKLNSEVENKANRVCQPLLSSANLEIQGKEEELYNANNVILLSKEEKILSIKNEFIIESKPVLSKEEDIKQKKGKIWTCIDRIVDAETGEFSYLFEIESKYNIFQNEDANKNYDEILPNMHPAVEYGPLSLYFLDPNHNIKDYISIIYEQNIKKEERNSKVLTPEEKLTHFNQVTEYITKKRGKDFEFAPIFNKLGFIAIIKENGTFQVQLPSRENLLQRWENLRKDCYYLPPLSISSSEGIASDDEFMDGYIKHDFLLSTGEEFFHDIVAHGIPILIQLLDLERLPYYIVEKRKIQTEIISGLNDISIVQNMIQSGIFVPDYISKNLPKMKAGFSALLDIWTASPNPKMDLSKTFFSDFISNEAWTIPAWQIHWKKRFSDENIDFNILKSVWNGVFNCIHTSKEYQLQELQNQLKVLQEEELTVMNMFKTQHILNEISAITKQKVMDVAINNVELITLTKQIS
jgi:hypothetical protein